MMNGVYCTMDMVHKENETLAYSNNNIYKYYPRPAHHLAQHRSLDINIPLTEQNSHIIMYRDQSVYIYIYIYILLMNINRA